MLEILDLTRALKATSPPVLCGRDTYIYIYIHAALRLLRVPHETGRDMSR